MSSAPFWIDSRLLLFWLLWNAAAWGACRVLPQGLQKRALIAWGLAFFASFLSAPAALALLASSVLTQRAARRPPALWAMAAAGAAALGAFAPALRLPFAAGFEGANVLRAFLLFYFLNKTAYLLYESRVGHAQAPSLEDVLLYFFAPPFLLGITFSLSFSHFVGSRAPAGERRRTAVSGLKTLAWAMLHWALYLAVVTAVPHLIVGAAFAKRAVGLAPSEVWLALFASYLSLYCLLYGYRQSCVASARLLGYDLDDAYDGPLLSTSYLELVRRRNVHDRRMFLAFWYYPAMLRLQRALPGRPALALALAALATFSGGALSYFVLRGLLVHPDLGRRWFDLVSMFGAFVGLSTAFVAASYLSREALRRAGWSVPGALAPAGVFLAVGLDAFAFTFLGRHGLDFAGALAVSRRSLGLP